MADLQDLIDFGTIRTVIAGYLNTLFGKRPRNKPMYKTGTKTTRTK
jgi:hypothetical protein